MPSSSCRGDSLKQCEGCGHCRTVVYRGRKGDRSFCGACWMGMDASAPTPRSRWGSLGAEPQHSVWVSWHALPQDQRALVARVVASKQWPAKEQRLYSGGATLVGDSRRRGPSSPCSSPPIEVTERRAEGRSSKFCLASPASQRSTSCMSSTSSSQCAVSSPCDSPASSRPFSPLDARGSVSQKSQHRFSRSLSSVGRRLI